MPFSSAQQAQLDAAQAQLDAAKAAYQGNVQEYNKHAALITPCYNDPVPSASDASTWFNTFSKGPCNSKGSCKAADCKATIDILNQIIPYLKSTYAAQASAQANYDAVFTQVVNEAAADPAHILHQQEIEANAAANKLKWIFWISVVVVVGIAAFVYFKWFRK